MPSILLINPNTSERTADMMLALARPLLPPGASITAARATHGDRMIVDEAGLALAATEVVRIGIQAAGRFDGIVVAAFGDPGAARLRTELAIPVVGIGEASIRLAASGGRRFGIATTTPGLVRPIETLVQGLGLGAGFTGTRVPDGDPLAFAADPDLQEAALAEAATRAIEVDGADAVVIGGGPLGETAARLRRRFAVAIIEPVPSAIEALLARLRTSRA